MITVTLSPILEINLYVGMGGNTSHDMHWNKLKFQRNSTSAKPWPPRRAPCVVGGSDWIKNTTFYQIVIPNTVRKMHPKDK